jgi:hypothetical protein
MTLSLFAVSFVVCAGMILTRLAELKRQKAFTITEFLNRANTTVEQKMIDLKVLGLKKKQEAMFFITHYVPFYAWNRARHLTTGLRQRYDKIERTVRGRNMIKQTGEASAFIKHIAEHKQSLSRPSESSENEVRQ